MEGMILVIAVIIICVIIFFWKKSQKKYKTNASIKSEREHVVKKIYMNEENPDIWICPNCETENLLSKSKCSVCYKER